MNITAKYTFDDTFDNISGPFKPREPAGLGVTDVSVATHEVAFIPKYHHVRQRDKRLKRDNILSIETLDVWHSVFYLLQVSQ